MKKIEKHYTKMYKHVLPGNLLSVLLILSVAGLLSSCITAKKVNYLQKPSGPIPAYNDDIGYEEYTISTSDKLYIRVYSPDKNINTIYNGSTQMMGGSMLSGSDYTDLYTYQVKDNGAISLPLVGDVYLTGQNIRQAKKTVENAIKTTMVDDC
ncbi:MAG: polysaccharide biosynthesis/export family protein, partial [Paludibacteraceae bacterium]|nr:polysaccharide biosynthesis/export family protein [Paludibacteraceae bacterium]